MNIWKTEELEKLLVANWAKVLDSKQVMAQVLGHVRDSKDLVETPMSLLKEQGVRLMVSRFQMQDNGYLIWFDFSVRQSEDRLAVGTAEMLLSNSGQLSLSQVMGNVFVTPRQQV